ncbi:MAG: hypothetical protein WD002_08425 [Pseudomonadales bacterium]
MFNFMKLGLHFTHMAYGALDPMVLELIRSERLMRQEQNRKVQEPSALVAGNDEANQDDLDQAA